MNFGIIKVLRMLLMSNDLKKTVRKCRIKL